MQAIIKADELRCYTCGEENTVIVTMDGNHKLRRFCDEQCFGLWNRHCATAFEERHAA